MAEVTGAQSCVQRVECRPEGCVVGLAREEAAGPEQDCGGDTEAGSMTVGGGARSRKPLPQLLEELGTES